MKTVTILKIEKQTLQLDNSEFLEVTAQIKEESGEVLEEKKLGFPLDKDIEEIKQELLKHLEEFEKEQENKVVEEQKQVQQAKAQETISVLDGVTLTLLDKKEPS